MREVEIDYYQRRELEETALAQAQLDLAVAKVHRELAALYRCRIEELTETVPLETQPILRSASA